MVAGVLINGRDEVLLARRPDHAHQGGLWEFPGGKLEDAEAPRRGLERELVEEIGIRVLEARPLLQVSHDYPDRRVLLDVWHVSRWAGRPVGREGQALRWVAVCGLDPAELPAADLPVVEAIVALNARDARACPPRPATRPHRPARPSSR